MRFKKYQNFTLHWVTSFSNWLDELEEANQSFEDDLKDYKFKPGRAPEADPQTPAGQR